MKQELSSLALAMTFTLVTGCEKRPEAERLPKAGPCWSAKFF